MSRVLWSGLIVVLLLGAGLWMSGLLPHCCDARQAPSRMETALANRLRLWSLPSGAAQRRNPLNSSPLQESARHFADHCASCHGNDGGGNTEMGRNLYPPAPDMRLPATQELSDGELYTAAEIRDMERFNPRSDADREEEKEEQEFLKGARDGDSAPKPQ